MDKKVMYGLGAVALIGAYLYFKNKQVTPNLGASDMTTPPEDMGAGAGGGGGSSAPSPTDMAMGDLAKNDVTKSMDLGGLDMASPKAEATAKNMAMATSMILAGKQVPSNIERQIATSPLKGIKTTIASKVIDVKGGLPSRDIAPKPKPIFNILPTPKPKPIVVMGKPPVPVLGKPPVAVVGKPLSPIGRTIVPTPRVVAPTPRVVAPAPSRANVVVSRAVSRPAPRTIVVAKKGFDGLDSYSFDGMDNMF